MTVTWMPILEEDVNTDDDMDTETEDEEAMANGAWDVDECDIEGVKITPLKGQTAEVSTPRSLVGTDEAVAPKHPGDLATAWVDTRAMMAAYLHLTAVTLVWGIMLAKHAEMEMEESLNIDMVSEKARDNSGRKKTGKLKMKRGITMDTAAHHSVMPKRMVATEKIRQSEWSKKGLNYVAANNGKIPNEGEADFTFETGEGKDETWTFQIAEVNKALCAVADRVDNQYKAVFDKDAKTGKDLSYLYHKPTGKVMKLTRVGNVWVIEAWIRPDKMAEMGFARRG